MSAQIFAHFRVEKYQFKVTHVSSNRKENKQFLLLTKYSDPKWPYLYDFCGRVDIEDKTVEETIFRGKANHREIQNLNHGKTAI